jgi:hypothetical protein
MGWTEAELAAVLAKRKPPAEAQIPPLVTKPAKLSKYRSQKTALDGYVFDSRKEAARYVDLTLLEKVGAIRDLALQVSLDCYGANGERVCGYQADFAYWSVEFGQQVYEDVKGGTATMTRLYRLKKKLLRAQGIVITEV